MCRRSTSPVTWCLAMDGMTKQAGCPCRLFEMRLLGSRRTESVSAVGEYVQAELVFHGHLEPCVVRLALRVDTVKMSNGLICNQFCKRSSWFQQAL